MYDKAIKVFLKQGNDVLSTLYSLPKRKWGTSKLFPGTTTILATIYLLNSKVTGFPRPFLLLHNSVYIKYCIVHFKYRKYKIFIRSTLAPNNYRHYFK